MFTNLFRSLTKSTRHFSKLTESEPFSKQTLDVHLANGLTLLRSNKLSEGRASLLKAADLSSKVFQPNSKEHSDYLNTLGRHLEQHNDLESALSLYIKVSEIDKILNPSDEVLIATHANRIGAIFADLGDLEKAEEHLGRIFNAVLTCRSDELKAAYFGNYGHVKMRSGDQKTALQYFLMAKEFQEKVNPKDEIMIKYLQSIGMCYWVGGEHTLAKEQFLRALGELKVDEVKNCLEIVDIYSHLGYLHNDLKQTEESFGYFQQALNSFKASALENKAEKIREFLKNITEAMKSVGDFVQSSKYLNLYLDFCKETFGENSRETAEGFQLFSSLHLRQKAFPEALEYAGKCLTICKTLENNHYDLFQCFNQFAVIFHKIGELEAAEKYLIQSGEILSKHPNERFQTSHHHNLALLYRDQQKLSEAESHMNHHVHGVKKHFGELHPATATAYISLGHIYRTSKNLPKSKEVYIKALGIFEQTLGKEHLNTADAMEFIGEICRIEKNFKDALEMHNQALNIRLKVMGPSHHSLHIPYFNLASTYLEMSEWQQAEKFVLRRMEVLKTNWGGDHTHVAGNYSFLAEVYLVGKDKGKAVVALEEAVRILKVNGNLQVVEELEKRIEELRGR